MNPSLLLQPGKASNQFLTIPHSQPTCAGLYCYRRITTTTFCTLKMLCLCLVWRGQPFSLEEGSGHLQISSAEM